MLTLAMNAQGLDKGLFAHLYDEFTICATNYLIGDNIMSFRALHGVSKLAVSDTLV